VRRKQWKNLLECHSTYATSLKERIKKDHFNTKVKIEKAKKHKISLITNRADVHQLKLTSSIVESKHGAYAMIMNALRNPVESNELEEMIDTNLENH